MKKVCVLTSRFPYPENGGDVVLINDIMQYFKDIGYEVILLSYYEKWQQSFVSKTYKNIDKIFPIKRNKFVSFFYSLLFFLLKKPIQCGYYFSKKMQKQLQLINEKYSPDIYVCHLLRMLPQFEAVGISNNVVVQMSDILSNMYELSKLTDYSLIKKIIYQLERPPIKRYEDYVFSKYKKIVLVSKKDSKVFENNPVVKYHNNGIRNLVIADKINSNKIVFIGNMRTLQNVDGCFYFINNIFPLILKDKPDAELHIVGASPSGEIIKMQSKNIKVTGYIENIEDYIKDSVVSVVPIRIASGIQNKILISMACHVPVIMSSLVSSSIPELINTENCFIEDNPGAFAEIVISLMNDDTLRNKLADAAMNLVKNNYYWNIHLQGYEKI